MHHVLHQQEQKRADSPVVCPPDEVAWASEHEVVPACSATWNPELSVAPPARYLS